LANGLTQAGLSVWYDRQLQSGLSWSKQLEDKLRASTILLVVLTPASVNSEAVRNEIHFAKELANIRSIIPLLREDCSFPLPLMGIQWVEGRVGLDDVVTNVIEAVKVYFPCELKSPKVAGRQKRCG
jgi:hypothetical protein